MEGLVERTEDEGNQDLESGAERLQRQRGLIRKVLQEFYEDFYYAGSSFELASVKMVSGKKLSDLNVILIKAQMLKAMLVGTRQEWEKKGVKVLDRETGLSIADVTDDGVLSIYPVFDVSQTTRNERKPQ